VGGKGGTNAGHGTGGVTSPVAAIDGFGGGGGGGGGSTSGRNGTPGGRGRVVFRYSGTPRMTGGTVGQGGGYTWHIFDSSGTLEPL
jgi:hypothetical protein